MPRGQKECPKCGKGTGPRTKVCDSCGYVYLQDSIDKVIDGIEISAKVGKKPCSNCSKEMESDNYHTDPYGKVTYFYKWDSYCSTSCLEAASERKDDLILEFLRKIEEYNSEELNSFLLDKRKEEDYRSLIEDVEKRAQIESENDEYRKVHPYIVHVSTPTKRITTPEELIDVGLRVAPKIGDYVSSGVAEDDDSPLKKLLSGVLSIDDLEDDSENEDSEESEESEDKSEDDDSGPLSLSSLLKKDDAKPSSSLSNLLSSNKPPIVNHLPTGIVYDASTKPRQGQKKCRTCGLIVGVRTRQCPKCSYKF